MNDIIHFLFLMAIAIPYKEVRVGDEPIEVDSSVAIDAIKNGATEFTLGAYHVCDVEVISFDTHIPMTLDGQDYGWFEDDEDILIEGHLCDTEQPVVMAIDDDNLHGSIAVSDGTEVTYSSQGTMAAHIASGHEFSDLDDDTLDPFRNKRREGRARSRRRLQGGTLEAASVDVHVKLEIDSDMVTSFGSDFAASRYGVELMALANQELYHATGFNLVVSQINIHTQRITSTTSNRDYLYKAQETPLPPNVNLVHVLSTRADMSGGVAFVGGLYSAPYGYGVSIIDGDFSLWDRMVMAHEIGHNFGSGHTHSIDSYDPLIDTCGNDGGSCGPFSETMSVMSYCHLCSGGLNNMFPLEWGPRVEQEILDIYWEKAGSWLASNWACNGFDSNIPNTGLTFVLYGEDGDRITCLSGGIDTSACGSDCALDSCEDAVWFWDEGASRIRSGKDVDYCWECQSGSIQLAACSASSNAQTFTMSGGGVSSPACGQLLYVGTEFVFASGDTVMHWCLAGADPTSVDTDGGGGGVSSPTGICEEPYLEMACNVVYTGSTGAPSGVGCWTFTAPSSQSVTFTSCGSSYDTMMEVLDASGSRIEFGDDDGNCGYQTILELDLQAGASYTVKLSGYDNAVGAYQMEAVCSGIEEPAATTDNPTAMPTPQPEATEPPAATTDSPTSGPTPMPTAHPPPAATTGGPTPMPTAHPPPAATTGGPTEMPTAQPEATNEPEAASIVCGQTVTGSTVGAQSQYGNRAGDAAFTFVAQHSCITFEACESDYDSYLRLYDANMNQVAYNDDHGGRCGGTNSYASHLEATSLNVGQAYTIVVDGYSSSEGSFVLTMICGSSEPEPEDRPTISCGQSVSGSTEGAANSVGNSAGDHIYSFVATTSDVTFDACQAGYDSYLRLMDANLLSQIDANDDHGGACGGTNTRASKLEATGLTVGATYNIVIEGYSREEGAYVLAMSCSGDGGNPAEPGTDLCGTSLSGSTVGQNSGVGNSAGEMTYDFTASSSNYIFDACGSNYDSYLRIYDSSGSQIAYNDDNRAECSGSGGSSYASHLQTSSLIPGNSYTLIVEGYGNNEGDFVVDITCPSSLAQETLLQHARQSVSAFVKPLESRNPIILFFAFLGVLSVSIFMLRASKRQNDYAVVLDFPEI